MSATVKWEWAYLLGDHLVRWACTARRQDITVQTQRLRNGQELAQPALLRNERHGPEPCHGPAVTCDVPEGTITEAS